MKIKKNFSRKIIIVISIAVIGLGYWGYRSYTSTEGETRYVLTTVKRGAIISSISGTGQVSAESQVDIKSKISGEVIYIGAVNGQTVRAGALIAQIDARDAEIALESAKITLEKLLKPADTSSILLAENSLADAKQSNIKAVDDLIKAYDDGFNTVSNAFLDIPDVTTGLNDILNSYQSGNGYLNDANVRSYGDTAMDYRDEAVSAYFSAKNKYDINLDHYKNLTRTSPTSDIELLIIGTYSTVKNIADAIKNSKNAFDYIKSQQGSQRSDSTTVLSNLNSWTSKMNAHLLSLLSIKNSIENSKSSIASYSRDIAQKTEALKKLKDGADALDIKSQMLAVKQKEYAYQDYFIRAQFDGIIAKLNVKKSDSITSGSNIGTLVTKQKVAEISLNEIDAAKVSVGDKTRLTFDAIEDLSLTGEVAEIDAIGTVTQGVVSYMVKIGFDSQNEQIKSGMTVNASIQIDVHQDVLTIPSSAVKTQIGISYVQVFNPALPSTDRKQGVVSNIEPQQVEVTVGISDDTNVEILSGLEEGQQIVTRTTTGNATTNTTPTKGARSGSFSGPSIRF